MQKAKQFTFDAFVEIATNEIVHFSGMALDTVKTMLTRKVYAYLQEKKRTP